MGLLSRSRIGRRIMRPLLRTEIGEIANRCPFILSIADAKLCRERGGGLRGRLLLHACGAPDGWLAGSSLPDDAVAAFFLLTCPNYPQRTPSASPFPQSRITVDSRLFVARPNHRGSPPSRSCLPRCFQGARGLTKTSLRRTFSIFTSGLYASRVGDQTLPNPKP